MICKCGCDFYFDDLNLHDIYKIKKEIIKFCPECGKTYNENNKEVILKKGDWIELQGL